MSCCTTVGAPAKDLNVNSLAAKSICSQNINTCGTILAGAVAAGSISAGTISAESLLVAGSTFIGPDGIQGPVGPGGLQGIQGVAGPAGIAGASLVSNFFAVMPPDNAATVAVGAAVQFPQDGPNAGAATRTGPSTFALAFIRTYMILSNVSVTEAGQLVPRLDGVIQANYNAGRATGTSQINVLAVITTTAVNQILEIVNPPGNAAALTITPNAGGASATSAQLVIIAL